MLNEEISPKKTDRKKPEICRNEKNNSIEFKVALDEIEPMPRLLYGTFSQSQLFQIQNWTQPLYFENDLEYSYWQVDKN